MQHWRSETQKRCCFFLSAAVITPQPSYHLSLKASHSSALPPSNATALFCRVISPCVSPARLGHRAVNPSPFVFCSLALKQEPAADEWRGVRDACSLIAARCNLACSLLWPTNTLTHIHAHESTHNQACTHGVCSKACITTWLLSYSARRYRSNTTQMHF